MKPARRFNQIDFLRGVACLMVVAFHYLFRGPGADWVHARPADWIYSVASFGDQGVPLFFIISGFVILKSAHGATPRSFLAARVARLYPAFWAGVLLTSACALLTQSTQFAVTLPQVLVNLTLVLPHLVNVEDVDGAYWSLAVEAHFYLLVWIVLRTGHFRHLERLILIWLALTSIEAWIPVYRLETWLCGRFASLFISGMLFYRIASEGWTARRALMLLWAWVMTLAVNWRTSGFPTAARQPEQFQHFLVVAALLCVFYLVFLAIVQGWFEMPAWPLVYWFGTLTYPVYLLHQNIGYMLIEQPFWADWSLELRAAVVLVLVVALAWLVNRYVERPLSRRLSRAIQDAPAVKLNIHATTTPSP